jgi:hypothetical protein
MSDGQDKSYSIGYGKPPPHTRFQKGKSGNPKGRPLGSRNTATLLAKTLSERVTVRKNGRQKKITKAELICELMVNKAASGDWGPLKLLFDRLNPSTEANVVSFPIGRDGKPVFPLTVWRDIILRELDEPNGGD